MFELLKKTYRLEILGKDLVYEQLSMYDCIEFLWTINEEKTPIEDWAFNFINQRIKISKKDMKKINITKFMDVMFDTAFKSFFNSSKKGSKYPFEAYIMFLSEKFNLDPDTLIKRYTPEQITYLVNGVIYNNNEQTKQGQARNRINKAMQDVKCSDREKDLAKIKEMEEKLNAKRNGNKKG